MPSGKFGNVLVLPIILAPVVVIQDIDSKNASVTFGIEPER